MAPINLNVCLWPKLMDNLEKNDASAHLFSYIILPIKLLIIII